MRRKEREYVEGGLVVAANLSLQICLCTFICPVGDVKEASI